MIIRIKYQDNTNKIHTLIEVEAADEFHIGKRNIPIDNVLWSFGNISIFLGALPARIDRQRDYICVMDQAVADLNPQPYQLYKDTAYFGQATTIWTNNEEGSK